MPQLITFARNFWGKRPSRRLALRTLAASMLVAGMAGGGATVASAHNSSASLYDSNGNRVGHGGVTASHHYVYACDDAADSKGVFIRFRASPFGGIVNDENGSAPGCTQSYWNPYVYEYQICRDNALSREHCTSWRRVH